MGRKKELRYRGNSLVGEYLSEECCDRLDKIIKLSDQQGTIYDLKNIIYELSDADVETVKQHETSNLFIDKRIGTLTNYETTGIAYLYWVKKAILGDSVGLGKTVQVAGLFNLLEKEAENNGEGFRFLYLTEKTLASDAQDAMIKFTGNYVDKLYADKAKVIKYIDEKASIPNSVVGVHSLINQSIFQEFILDYRRDLGYNPFDIIVIDESSILGNDRTQTFKNAIELVEGVDRVVLLNATPFEKQLKVFYNQLAFLDKTLLPTKTEFNKRFVITKWINGRPMETGKYKNESEFKELVKYRYLHRTRIGIGSEVGTNCSAEIILSDLDTEQKELLKKTQMPYMVYNCPSYFNGFAGSDVSYDKVPPKAQSLISLINERLKNERNIMVYCYLKEAQGMLERVLKDQGYSVAVMNGDNTPEEKDITIRMFKAGETKILITNVQKGLNFGNCNHCIFYSFNPNPNQMVQFEGRMTRGTDIINKHSYILCSRGKEFNRLKDVVSDRAKASNSFAGSDFSCVLWLLIASNMQEDENGIIHGGNIEDLRELIDKRDVEIQKSSKQGIKRKRRELEEINDFSDLL